MCLPSTCGTGTLSGRPIGSVPCLLDRADNPLLVRSWLWQSADSSARAFKAVQPRKDRRSQSDLVEHMVHGEGLRWVSHKGNVHASGQTGAPPRTDDGGWFGKQMFYSGAVSSLSWA